MTKIILLAAAAAFTFHVQANPLYFSALNADFTKNEFCSYSFSVPQVAPAPGADPQVGIIAKALNAKWKAELQTDIADFENSILDPVMCKEFQSSYQLQSTFNITSEMNATIVSILTTDTGFTGGAHGFTALSSFVFNARTGQSYASLGDFFDDSKVDALKIKILEYIRYGHEDFDPEFGFNEWSKTTDSTYKIRNFYFTPDGMTIFFNQYEVASYAEGPILAELPWSELKTIGLKTDGPATELPVSRKNPGH